MAPSLLAAAGAQPIKQSRFKQIHVSKALHGEITNRFALQDPSAFIVERFYGGYQDCLLGGSNVEISPRNTWWRRPGCSAYTTFDFPTPPIGGFSFNMNGTFTLYVDTATNIYSVTPTSGTSVFTKAAGAGQASYLQLGSTLFIADGVDAIKIIGGKVWNWGIIGPADAPTVVVTASGAAAVTWTASTVFTTMGLLVDSNGNVQQLVSVNADGSQSATATIGTTGTGAPSWNQTPGGTTTESTGTPITWTNKGPIVAWTANTTYNDVTTGGTLANPAVIYDPVSNACYIGDTQGQSFVSSSSKPHFTGTFAQKLKDGTGYWVCLGAPTTPPLWLPSTSYPLFGSVSFNDGVCSISEPQTPQAAGIGTNTPQLTFLQASGGGTSGTGGTAPKWATVTGTLTADNQLQWLNLGSATWAANTAYSQWSQGKNFVFSVIEDQNNNLQVCITSGTSATIKPSTTFVLSAAANASAGDTTYTGTFSPTLPANSTVAISGFTTPANNGTFTVVSCNATTLVVNNPAGVAESHAGVATFNPWGTLYGQNTTDGTVIWVCVGTFLSWTANTKWYLPLAGFIPPQPTDPYGGSEIIDSNGDIQIAINNGKSGSSHPTWATTLGAQTQDPISTGTLVWINQGVASTNSLVFSAGFGYAYAFKARTATDFYVTNIPNGLTAPLGPPTGSGDGSISTASPIFKMATGPNAGAVIQLSGVGSLDPQVDTIVIYRSTDGFQGGPYFELTEIPNPQPVNGVAGTWNFNDYFPDVDLNNLIEADVVGLNDPPPAGLTNLAYHFGRVWGSVQNIVYASSGPDIPPDNGNGLTGWGPANNFPLTSPVSKLLAPITGLLAFTTTDEWTIAGGPAITQFFPSITRAGVGLLTPNGITSLGAEIILFTADRRLLAFIPGAGETNVGWYVQDQLQNYNPAVVYLTLHENGIDRGVFLGNGSTTYKRVVIHSQPNNDIVWDTTATITGGCGMLQSIQTAAGVRTLLIGGTGNNEPLLQRDLTTNQDNGSNYTGGFIVSPGPICHDGEMAELGFLTWTGPRTGTTPTISYLLNETSGTYQQFASLVNDPPLLYGTTVTPTTVYRNRYYFKQTMSTGNPPPAIYCTDILLQVAFIAENAANEMARFTLYGGLYQDGND